MITRSGRLVVRGRQNDPASYLIPAEILQLEATPVTTLTLNEISTLVNVFDQQLEDINSPCLSPTSSDGATFISASLDVILPSRADRSFVAERKIIFPHLQIFRKTESQDLSVNVDESVVVSQSHVFLPYFTCTCYYY